MGACVFVCDLETLKRGGLGPIWAAEPHKTCTVLYILKMSFVLLVKLTDGIQPSHEVSQPISMSI